MHEGIHFDEKNEPAFLATVYEFETEEHGKTTLRYRDTTVRQFGPEFAHMTYVEYMPDDAEAPIALYFDEERMAKILDLGFPRRWDRYPSVEDLNPSILYPDIDEDFWLEEREELFKVGSFGLRTTEGVLPLSYDNCLVRTYGPRFEYVNHIEYRVGGEEPRLVGIRASGDNIEKLLEFGFPRRWDKFPNKADSQWYLSCESDNFDAEVSKLLLRE